MTEFLIKSTVSLTVLLAFYQLFLEREKIHRFNRFYLLGALAISFAIPFVTFEIIQEIPTQMDANSQIMTNAVFSDSVASTSDWPLMLGVFYATITFFMMWRFTRNINRFFATEEQSDVKMYNEAKLILTAEKILPHTFLNRIFINKEDYENRKIEDELFAHELVHVNQKHTLDILFAEFLIMIMWFNPLLYLYKKAIQLNHEFLADEKVIDAYQDVASYQQLLLSKSSEAPVLQLASNLNFGLTKKRLLMMTKNTSPAGATIRKISIAPILFALVYFTCVETVAQVKEIPAKQIDQEFIKKFTVAYNKAYTDNLAKDTLETNKILKTRNLPEERSVTTVQDTIYSVNELSTPPEFPGGMSAFYKFIGQEYRIPDAFSGSGRVFVTLVIEKDGSLSNLKVIRDAGNGTGEEALRVLQQSPNWKPGTVDGSPVRVMYSLPITLQQK